MEERARREGLKRERLLDAYNKRMAKVRNSANSNNGVENDEDFRERSAIFRRLIRRWKQLVEHNGGKFYAVLLPEHNPAASPRVPDLLQKENIETISLYDCFGTYDAEHYQRRWSDSPYRFKSKSDGHWNEAGNQLAAMCLYRVLEEDMRLPALSEETLRATLHRYYAAFGGWMPVNTRGGARIGPPVSLVDDRWHSGEISGPDPHPIPLQGFQRVPERWVPALSQRRLPTGRPVGTVLRARLPGQRNRPARRPCSPWVRYPKF